VIQVEPGGTSEHQSLLRPPLRESVGSELGHHQLLGPHEIVGTSNGGRGMDPAEFADKYGYGLPQELSGRIQGEVEPGGKSKAQVLQAPVRTESLGSEKGHFEAERSPIPRGCEDPEEFADRYGYGLPLEHIGQIKVEPGGKSRAHSLPPMVRQSSLVSGHFETAGVPSADRGVDPVAFADKYGYGLPEEHPGRIQGELEPGGKSKVQVLPPMVRSESLISGHFETVGGAIAGSGVDPEEFADKYGYGLPEEQMGRIQGEVEPGGKSMAQLLRAPDKVLGSEQGLFEAVEKARAGPGVDPLEFAARYGYGLPEEHPGRIQGEVEPGGKSKVQSLPPMVRVDSLVSGHFEAVGGASAGRGVDPAEFADKYGYGLPHEQSGRIQGKVEPGGKSKAQVLQAPVRTESLGSEQGHFEAERSPTPRRRVDPEEFSHKYGYGLPQDHVGQIKVDPKP